MNDDKKQNDMKKRKATIAEIEALLDGSPCQIQINPDGSLATIKQEKSPASKVRSNELLSPVLDYILLGDRTALMEAMPENSIDMIVTSPPYNCGKQYGTNGDSVLWEQYWLETRKWLSESFRIMKPGARLAVNLPWWMGKKPRRDVPFEFKRLALDIGYLMLDKITWIKGDANNLHTSGGWGGNGCGWGTYLSPSGPSIRCASEPILIFSKGNRGRGVISGEGRGACVRGDMTKKEWMSWTLDVWFVRGASDKDHPAVFPSEIPRRLIKLYTYPGETVLDMHCGRGTTCVVAQQEHRHFIGIDREYEYVNLARSRIESGRG